MPEMSDPFCPSFIQPCSQHGTNPLAAIAKGENGFHNFTLTTKQCYNMTVAATASPVSEIRILKGKWTKGASWPGTQKLCKIFATAHFIWLFYCYPYKRSAFLLHTVELNSSPMKSRKRLAHDIFGTSATRAGLVYNITTADSWAQIGSTHGCVFSF